MLALQGVGVLVTRPSHQATRLCVMLEAAGASTIRLPAIDIQLSEDLADVKHRLGSIDTYDLIIFTSANAVHGGIALLQGNRRLVLAAIGPATARALGESGYPVAVTPRDGFDSESLLRHLAVAHPGMQRILLIKGAHGREHLTQQLTERGAQVAVADVYRRERAQPTTAQLAAVETALASGNVHVITATSVDVADGLLDQVTPAMRLLIDKPHWLVPGTRVADALRQRGVTAPVLLAKSAEDQDLVDAVVRWRSSVSGA